MAKAGITDPESQVGKDFCTQKCPYDRCIVFESTISPYSALKNKRVARAREMRSDGQSLINIARELKVRMGTVKRYLDKRR